MKKILVLLLVATLFTISFAACGQSDDSSAKEETGIEKSGDTAASKSNDEQKSYKIKITNMLAADHPESLTMFKFKELIEERSEGNITVEVYPNSQLGPPETYIDSLLQGAVEMALPGTTFAERHPLIATPELPFLMRDWDHARKVLTGELGKEMVAGLPEKLGVRGLGWTPVSFRVVTSNFPIESFEDFEGMRLRVPNIPFYIEFAKGLNTNPITMSFTELFTGLEQKVVDGQENPYATIQANKFYEVQPYVLDTKHMFTSHPWFVNEKFYQSLTDEYKQMVEECVTEAIEYSYEISIKAEQDAIDYIQEQGVEILYPDDQFRQKLVESQKETREFFFDQYPGSEELAKKIEAIQ